MRTRALYTYTTANGEKRTNVVWFGSTGIVQKGFDSGIWDVSLWDADIGNAEFYNEQHTSFSEKQRAVVDSLVQRLSIIRGELWYDIKYGLPLFEKTKSKIEFDSFILSTISKHPDVESIISFKSQILNSNYTCEVKIQSRFGQITVTL